MATIEAAERVRQELERERVDDGAERPAGRQVARRLAEHVGEGQGEEQQPEEDDEQPALDPDPGRQPAPQVHARSSSRWKTATGPKSRSRSHVASSSAMTIERW